MARELPTFARVPEDAVFDLIVRGGQVVTPQGVGQWDVAVRGEKIVAVSVPDERAEAGRIIDATGKIVEIGRASCRERVFRSV